MSSKLHSRYTGAQASEGLAEQNRNLLDNAQTSLVKGRAGSFRRQTRRRLFEMASASALGLALADNASAAVSGTVSGPLRSAGVLTFGPDNVLFVGDIIGAAVHAFPLRGSDITEQDNVLLGNFHNFEGHDLLQGADTKLAALLGTTADKIVINDIAVHGRSQQLFLSVERGRGIDAKPVIVKLNHGALEIVDLSRIPHTQTAIANEPDAKAMLEFDPQQMYAITDVEYYKGEIFVTGISNQRFASTIHRIAYPFSGTKETSTAEIWHPVHGEWETRAPIIRHIIRELNGVPYLFAVYGCTPLVRFRVSSLKNGAHVRGDLIGELGYGSNPLDLLTFKDPSTHKDYLVVTSDTRSASRIAVADMESAMAQPTGGGIDFGPGGLGKTQTYLPIKAEHIAALNDKWAVIVWRHPRSTYRLDISTLAMPYFFERKDGMAEMNWPNGPDPFGYGKHRSEMSTTSHP